MVSDEGEAWLRAHSFDADGKPIQIFTFVTKSGNLHINASALRKAIDAGQVIVENKFVGLVGLYEEVLARCGIEEHHIQRYSPDDAAFTPIIVCIIGDREMIVDGNHGLVKAYRMGLRMKPALFVTQEQWSAFLVKPPADVAALFAGDAVEYAEKRKRGV